MQPERILTLSHHPLSGHSHRVHLALFFLTGPDVTIADVSAYSYIAAAPESKVDLADYPQPRAWLARVAALPGFVPFQHSAVSLAT